MFNKKKRLKNNRGTNYGHMALSGVVVYKKAGCRAGGNVFGGFK